MTTEDTQQDLLRDEWQEYIDNNGGTGQRASSASASAQGAGAETAAEQLPSQQTPFVQSEGWDYNYDLGNGGWPSNYTQYPQDNTQPRAQNDVAPKWDGKDPQ